METMAARSLILDSHRSNFKTNRCAKSQSQWIL